MFQHFPEGSSGLLDEEKNLSVLDEFHSRATWWYSG